jgi:hypothetical protein
MNGEPDFNKTMSFLHRSLFLTSMAFVVAAQGGVITEPARVYTVGYTLEDFQDPPALFVQTISDSSILQLTEVRVGLNLVGATGGGGFAGEIFVSLTKDLGASAVLLNRVGVTSSDAVGFGYDGWDVVLRDAAVAGDIHAASLSVGVLKGEWEPDGRLDATTEARLGMLQVFVGQAGNGEWSLNVADLDYGGIMRLESWSLTLTGLTEANAVPEATGLGGVGACFLAYAWKLFASRRRKGT